MTASTAPSTTAHHPPRWRQFYALTKPRVVQLIVFCAVIGMFLAVPGLPDWRVALAATAGIWLVAAAAAAFNCLVEQLIDRRMARTAWRPALLSKIAPRTLPSSSNGIAAQEWNTRRTFCSSTIS